jgi:hypothetical protein
MSNPFGELRQLIDEAEARVRVRLESLERENAYLRDENAKLWADVHARQDAEAGERRRTGT